MNKMTKYIATFVDELARVGVNDIVISPGSRSTPLVMLMEEHEDINTWVQVDERSASFFALGMAKAKGEPVALVCTSGTAVANYLPAVVEAYYSRVPLIVLTADRPHELRDVGAPQAIDQMGIFGKYAKWFVEMPLPDDKQIILNFVRTVADKAVGKAMEGPSGAVHINFPLRDPLVPNLALEDLWEGGRLKGRSYVNILSGVRKLEKEQIKELALELEGIERGLIVCGPDTKPHIKDEVCKLAALLNYPLLADPLSQVRSGNHDKEWVIDSYDAFLRSEKIKEEYQPEIIIRFGAMPVSKAFLLYVEGHDSARQIIIDGDAAFRDPTSLASDVIHADQLDFCTELVKILKPKAEETSWAKKWKKLNKLTRNHMLEKGKKAEVFEGRVIIELEKILPDDVTLFVGNSMPVRDLDSFFTVTDKTIHTMCNRGANGIDGVVSSAIGASVVRDPLVLVIGDLSFFHDLNGLLAAKFYQPNITIILVNNDGGGIFSFLPQAKNKKHFELLFGIPMGLDFSHVVDMYEGGFRRVSSWDEFRKYVDISINTKGLSVIEVPSKRQENTSLHREIWDTLSQKININWDKLNDNK